jgi:hypothetical protein
VRRETLDERIAELAAEPRFAAVVGRLSCLRGVGTLTAFALCVEIGDWHRLRGGVTIAGVQEREARLRSAPMLHI